MKNLHKHFSEFLTSELSVDRERADVLASKMTDTIDRLVQGESVESVVDGIDQFIGDFREDFAKLADQRKKKQTRHRRRQKKKSQMDMFKSRSRS